MKFNLLLSISLVLLGLQACSKKEASSPPGTSTPTNFPGPRGEVVISKKWKMTDQLVEYSNGLPPEDFTNVPSCQKDNMSSFTASHRYIVDEAVDICSGNPASSTKIWDMNNDETQINLAGTWWGIKTLNQNTLKITRQTDNAGVTVYTTVTYTSQ